MAEIISKRIVKEQEKLVLEVKDKDLTMDDIFAILRNKQIIDLYKAEIEEELRKDDKTKEDDFIE